MPPLFTWLLLVLPLAAYALSRRYSEAPGPRWGTAGRCAALFALGLVAAEPFLTHRGVGTGEAYNYSLALHDGLVQIRAGEVPPLVGQTEYAFNGRIHPLRNAPYLFYLAAGLDAATFHRLSAWELQNLSLAFSLVAAAFACYGGLRWSTGCGRTLAFLFAGAYVLSPAVLASAYAANLFMTVHAAAFVPLALAACFRQCRYPSPRADLLLGAALAAVWLAHPPVAFWLTLAAVVVRGLVFLRYPTWKALAALSGGTLLCFCLAAYVFASVESISASVGFFNADAKFGPAVMPVLRSAFPLCLLPVSRVPLPASVGDFQLGYVGWTLLAVLAILTPRYRRRPRIFWAAGGSLLLAALLLALAVPVPGLTEWLWDSSPKPAQALTNIWPMQRVYLVALGLVLFAAATAWPRSRPSPRLRRMLAAAAVLGAGWTVWEARAFLARGDAMHRTRHDTAIDHLSSNIDLTVTAYSFLGTPPTFVNGVMDPWMEFSLQRDGGRVDRSNYDEALRISPTVARGAVSLAPQAAPARVTLQPGRRYLLTFAFHAPSATGTLLLTGPTLSRRYYLPAAGGPSGFGMEPGNRRALSLWIPQDRPEEVAIRFEPESPPPPGAGALAEFTLQEIPLERLPVRLDSLFPMRLTVDAPGADEYVDTPRRWLPGYVAYVNGRRIEPLKSPTWDVMVPVPTGRSVVELDYAGAPSVRRAFWLSATCWLGFLAWSAGRTAGLRRSPGLERRLRRESAHLLRLWPAAAAAVVLAAGAWSWHARRAAREAALAAAGPLRVAFYLPFHEPGRAQALLSTGHSGAGTTLFLRYLSEDRVKVGADIWGNAYESAPLPVNLFRPQSLVLDSTALYPLDNPRVQALPPAERDRLRGELRVELNGRLALSVPRPSFDSLPAEIAVGRSTVGSSGMEVAFGGEILSVERLPIPRRWILAGREALGLRVRFPRGKSAATEALAALGPEGVDGYVAAAYLPQGPVRLARLRADGSVADQSDRVLAPGSEHQLQLTLGPTTTPGAGPAVSLRVDGQAWLGAGAPAPLGAPEELTLGFALRPPDGVAARFTGPLLSVENPEPSPVLSGRGFGAVQLIVLLPPGRTTRQEPLLTTGRTGKGDFIYVLYLDDRHIRLGFDHWGVSGGLSDPIEIDYAAPHAFTLSLGSLYPAEGDPAWGAAPAAEQRRLKSEMTVSLDGRQVYSASFSAHPAMPAEVVAGLNPIGGSNCDPQFQGVLYSARRLPLP